MIHGVELGHRGRMDDAGGVDHVDDSAEAVEESLHVGGDRDVTDDDVDMLVASVDSFCTHHR